ncbi:M50 family metallopeptidase [Streptomyces apocyni]|uniref:M50 family metallopeptidase n=1 Tax=Streptomyces apocyni TaxID=2654677 RepID=UPI0012EA0DE7|nr:M50 family metallopeptidase [Streptomyces apocyni]
MSAPAAAIAAYRPALRPGVLLSERLLQGASTVHLIKDTGSGQSFKVGVKEHFLISRMDGERSIEEIGTQYARQYGRRLADANWQQLLGMLGTRGLLADAPAATAPEAPPEPRGLLRGSIRLVADANATTARLHRAVGFLLTPLCMVPLLALMVAMEVVIAFNMGELLVATWELFQNPVLLMATGSMLWLSTALHELAHGVVARHYGGTVAEIGLRWRLPAVIMYCTVDNFLYLPARRHRIATAVAGAVMNLLFLLPFCALWLFVPVDEATHGALAGLLFLGSVQALAMLIPVPPLDGYKIVAQAFGATELAASSKTYLRLAIRRDPAAKQYPRRARAAYTTYGLGAPLVLAALIAAVAAIVHYLLTTV